MDRCMTETISKPAALNSDQPARVLFYSHDTFGLGHLRRSRTLATALTETNDNISALIITGSTVAGRFSFPDRVDYVRLPGVTKRADGSYISDKLSFDIDGITAVRSALITALVKEFKPDLFIVDKEATGFRGELLPALDWLKNNHDTQLVLGLRDVLDSPDPLREEWQRKGVPETIENYYDEIWIYGLKSIYDPVQKLNLSDCVRSRMHWTGYLKREVSGEPTDMGKPYVLVTAGGGGDGRALVDQVISAYEQAPDLLPDAVLVYGPFLSGDLRAEFDQRVNALQGRITALGFESQMENLMAGASGVVAMGGYNVFCEILSCDIPTVIVPRTKPRLEQYIRASRAEELGLIRMLDKERDGTTPESMINAIRQLPNQPRPSAGGATNLLGGLPFVAARANKILGYESSVAV